jgi:hypothetical protein
MPLRQRQEVQGLPRQAGVTAAWSKKKRNFGSAFFYAAGHSGARRRVLGIECEVFNGADLVLEDRIAGISVSTAVQAKFDAPVSAAVFAPHAGGGFRLNQRVGE